MNVLLHFIGSMEQDLSSQTLGVSLEPLVYYFIDKNIARAYNTKNLCLLIGQILIDNVRIDDSRVSFECSLKTLNRDLPIEQTTPNASQG